MGRLMGFHLCICVLCGKQFVGSWERVRRMDGANRRRKTVMRLQCETCRKPHPNDLKEETETECQKKLST